MCGIAGYFHATPIFETLDTCIGMQMANAINHRGPDDSGTWTDGKNIVLAHARLSIQDLSPAGHQPMHSANGRYVMAFNGEIYNHLDLRALLESSGVAPHWNGHSDTETLLACFESWGIIKTLQSTVGMFAIALWDCTERKLTLARDRLGEKPLFWGWQHDALLFGSELKALKIHPLFESDIDRSALALYIRHNYVPAPYSIYQGIKKLMPGHYVTIAAGQVVESIHPSPYWSLNEVVQDALAEPLKASEPVIINTLENQLSESIGLQMMADVPLGAFLSGGVDSSLIVSLMQKQSDKPVKTFTIGFNEAGFNEAEHALAVSKYLGTEHTEIYIQSHDALDVIPKLPTVYCEPFADSSQIPTFLVSQLAKQHVSVVLSGDAGDELFGGYNPYQFAPEIWNVIGKFPVQLRRAVANGLKYFPLPSKLSKLNDVLDAPNREIFYRQLLSHWKHPESIVLNATEPPTLLDTASSWPKCDTFQQWMMAMDTQTYMVDDILVKVDRAGMASSLETRIPLLDHRVVELAWRIPAHFKIRDGKGKWILREILHRHIPRELFERPKKGFSIPIGQWLRGPLKSWAESLLAEERIRQEGFFNVIPIRKIWEQHMQGKYDHSAKLWGVLMFQAWLEEQRR